MARIRSIKPEFWTSDQIVECSPNARLLFVGIWNFCDDHGRHPLSPKRLKAVIFPSDNFSADDIASMLIELADQKLIACYLYDDKAFFYVTGWKHQKIDKRQPAKYPAPTNENVSPIRELLADHSPNGRRMVSTDRIGEDRKGRDQTPIQEDESQLDVRGNLGSGLAVMLGGRS